MKTRVQNLQDRFMKEIESQDGKCNTCRYCHRYCSFACDEVKQVETVLLRHHERLKLQRAPFVNDLILHLQQVAYQVVCSAEEIRISEQQEDLERMREKKRETFIATASNEADDLERAARCADEYNEQLKVWVMSKVHEFASEVRDQGLQQMQDPEKAAERAYHSSFKRVNYDEVLEYCIDVNAYLKNIIHSDVCKSQTGSNRHK